MRPLAVAIIGVCMLPPSPHHRQARTLATVPIVNIGNQVEVPAGAAAFTREVLRCDLDVAQPLQIVLKNANRDGTPGVPSIGQWTVEWGAGGAAPVQVVVDAKVGVTFGLHASFVRATFTTSDATRVDGIASAFIGGDAHGTDSEPPTNTSESGGVVLFEVQVPPFATSLSALSQNLGVPAAIFINFEDRAGTIFAVASRAAGDPAPVTIPGRTQKIAIQRQDGAASIFTATFRLQL